MATVQVDAKGLKCPQPILKVAAKAHEMKPGDILEVVADCPTFPKDIQIWCERTGKTMLFCRDDGGGRFKAQVQF